MTCVWLPSYLLLQKTQGQGQLLPDAEYVLSHDLGLET